MAHERNTRNVADDRVKAGFYGLDLYSLYRSMQEVITYLEGVDPHAAARARERYACFDLTVGGTALRLRRRLRGRRVVRASGVDQLVESGAMASKTRGGTA